MSSLLTETSRTRPRASTTLLRARLGSTLIEQAGLFLRLSPSPTLGSCRAVLEVTVAQPCTLARSPEAAGAYVRSLQAVLRRLGVSDANMDKARRLYLTLGRAP